MSFLFTSDRLGFRTWHDSDLESFAQMNADPNVMRHFPSTLSDEESADFLKRLQLHYEKHGHCYFYTELLETGEFIGFVGLAYQIYESDYTPAVDIGWRLRKEFWGKGYATEGARRCLEFAFQDLGINRIISTCTILNSASEHVMQKIGMQKLGEFLHPRLKEFPDLEGCVVYEIKAK